MQPGQKPNRENVFSPDYSNTKCWRTDNIADQQLARQSEAHWHILHGQRCDTAHEKRSDLVSVDCLFADYDRHCLHIIFAMVSPNVQVAATKLHTELFGNIISIPLWLLSVGGWNASSSALCDCDFLERFFFFFCCCPFSFILRC